MYKAIGSIGSRMYLPQGQKCRILNHWDLTGKFGPATKGRGDLKIIRLWNTFKRNDVSHLLGHLEQSPGESLLCAIILLWQMYGKDDLMLRIQSTIERNELCCIIAKHSRRLLHSAQGWKNYVLYKCLPFKAAISSCILWNCSAAFCRTALELVIWGCPLKPKSHYLAFLESWKESFPYVTCHINARIMQSNRIEGVTARYYGQQSDGNVVVV